MRGLVLLLTACDPWSVRASWPLGAPATEAAAACASVSPAVLRALVVQDLDVGCDGSWWADHGDPASHAWLASRVVAGSRPWLRTVWIGGDDPVDALWTSWPGSLEGAVAEAFVAGPTGASWPPSVRWWQAIRGASAGDRVSRDPGTDLRAERWGWVGPDARSVDAARDLIDEALDRLDDVGPRGQRGVGWGPERVQAAALREGVCADPESLDCAMSLVDVGDASGEVPQAWRAWWAVVDPARAEVAGPWWAAWRGWVSASRWAAWSARPATGPRGMDPLAIWAGGRASGAERAWASAWLVRAGGGEPVVERSEVGWTVRWGDRAVGYAPCGAVAAPVEGETVLLSDLGAAALAELAAWQQEPRWAAAAARWADGAPRSHGWHDMVDDRAGAAVVAWCGLAPEADLDEALREP